MVNYGNGFTWSEVYTIVVKLYKGETMSKKNTNEGLFSTARKFSDAFFNGLQKNTQDKFIQRAKKAGTPKALTDKMEKIRKEKAELDALIKKYSK